MKLMILGCGSSMGVPSISCKCPVCISEDKHNKRLRTSALIEQRNTKILIDTGPDFRQQALNNKFDRVDGIIYTHAHADHINGINDIRALKPTSEKKCSIPIYTDKTTLEKLIIQSEYLFSNKLPETPWNKSFLHPNIVNYYEQFHISNVPVVPFPQEHGKITSLGLIFDNKIAYCTDVKKIPDRAINLLKGIEILVIECLGYKETLAHAHFDLTLAFIDRIKPKTAIFTHMSHELEFNTLNKQVREYKNNNNTITDIIVPYDGYSIEAKKDNQNII
ncbi:MAG: MBL fold metallo-hydrolase [Rickettsiaceae bacterium H1]|nr:MBL fold metallo-hydrolase [Rickettsiaceae bacterium H1]